MRIPLTLAFIAFEALALTAPAFSAPTPLPTQLTGDQRAATICVGNEADPFTIYGALRPGKIVDTEPSYVEIYPQTDVSDYYLSRLESSFNGATPTTPPNADLSYVQEQLSLTNQAIAMRMAARRAPLTHTGQFECRGISAGKYSLLGKVHALAKTQNSGSRDSYVNFFYRADIEIPATKKSKALFPVTNFRLIGRNPR